MSGWTVVVEFRMNEIYWLNTRQRKRKGDIQIPTDRSDFEVPVERWQPVEQETQHYLTSLSHLGIQDGSVRGELLAVSTACLPPQSEITHCCRTNQTQLICSLSSTFSSFGRRI
ncbi:hypothetical protein AALO_G00285460 [Alosa alosa]|uniref:Uncharacterized protein n=1 Tax=Alosa alosa TaxID=278164 RepID=A0AAV6FFG7_9TELE|nr:hypothetical protein AALO_G00285460 [Alosa alosa]